MEGPSAVLLTCIGPNFTMNDFYDSRSAGAYTAQCNGNTLMYLSGQRLDAICEERAQSKGDLGPMSLDEIASVRVFFSCWAIPKYLYRSTMCTNCFNRRSEGFLECGGSSCVIARTTTTARRPFLCCRVSSWPKICLPSTRKSSTAPSSPSNHSTH